MRNRVKVIETVLHHILLLNFIALISAMGAMAQASSPDSTLQVPLREGLTLVVASQQDRGDFEIIKTITKVDPKTVTVAIVSDEPTVCGEEVLGRHGSRPSKSLREVLREDMESAHTLRFTFKACLQEPEFNRGVTAISVSAKVLRELKTEGRTNLNFIGDGNTMYPGTLTRVERQTVRFKVILNDEPVELATVYARFYPSQFGQKRWADYWILDDASNPLVLRTVSSSGKVGLDVVKLSFPTEQRTVRLERDLSNQGRTVVYGIYFNFASDQIKDESELVLKDIADVMTKNPTWQLAVQGHTDSLGETEANLQLSRRRAAAISKALSERYKIAPTRLKSAGFGETKPKATNETLEGRALNRRVELVRIGR